MMTRVSALDGQALLLYVAPCSHFRWLHILREIIIFAIDRENVVEGPVEAHLHRVKEIEACIS